MRNIRFIRTLSIFVLLSIVVLPLVAEAQPGGPPPGGGRPPAGGPGKFRPGKFPGQENDNNQQQQKKTVRKKIIGNTYKVVGTLRDSVSGETLPFVNVSVLERADSTFVKGASSDFNGEFEVTGVPAGEYLLRVSAIGYRNYYHPFTVENNTALGTLKLKQGATTLQEVQITADRPLYAMDGEKMIYNVSDDPSIQTGTTEDALQNAPGVEVDVEGNITLRGVSSVEIWINDKPSKLTEENLKTYLQTLPANALARIETITNPSAKYATDAEAVINIITSAHIKSNQFVSFGLNGSNQPFVSPWISYMWAKEKLSFNIFASGRYSKRDNTSESWSMRRDTTAGGVFDTTFYQGDTSKSQNISSSGNFFANLNYEIDSMSELSVDAGGFYNYNRARSYRQTDQTFYNTSIGDSLLAYTIGDTSKTPSYFTHAGADYTKKFDNEGHNLRIGINTRLNRNAGDDYYDRTYTTYSLPGKNENRYLKTDNYGYGLSLDARYNRPYSKDGELSYGLRADHQQSKNDYRRYYSNDGGNSYDSVDALRTYHFNGQETNLSLDVNWTHRWGGFTLSSGLGYELGRTYYSYSDNPYFTDDSSFFTHSLRPSIHLTYRTADMNNYKLNYTMRMSHAGEEDLTRFKIYGEDSYRTGNPSGLKPSYTHSLEAGWQKFFETFGNVGIEAYGRWSTNEISSLTDSEDDDLLERIVSYTMPYNMGSSWRYGSSLNMTYRPSGFFNVRLYANVYNYGYHLDNYRGQPYDNNKWSWSARINGWAKIFDQYQITMSLNYSSPTIGLMSEQKARYWFNIGARSDFFKRKLSVFVNVQDLFNWGARYGSGSENTNPYYLSESTSKMINSRYISVGITLRFGKMELERNAKDGSSESGDSL